MAPMNKLPRVISEAKPLPFELKVDTEKLTRLMEGLALIVLSLLISA
ncbi:MAG: hypothetical protein HYV97_10690 [Bdellovibrio sp.]|nr:hypothetical protein [Bdellovibrio sp.]